METRAHYVIIGLFTIIVVTSALLFSLWLTKSGNNNQFKLYDIVFNESVNGLSQGSSVLYSGIKVGEVSQLRLDTQDPNRVWARVKIVDSTPIHQQTQAKLIMSGITGIASIQLSSGITPGPIITNEDDDHIPVIIATPSPLSLFLDNSQDLVGNINQMLGSINAILTPENATSLHNTLANIEIITQTIADDKEDIRQLIKELTSASQEANATLTQSTQLFSTLNTMLNRQGKQIINNTDKTMSSLAQSSAQLNTILANNKDAISNGLKGLNGLDATLNELYQTLHSYRTIANQLEESPTDFLLGRPNVKEYQP